MKKHLFIVLFACCTLPLLAQQTTPPPPAPPSQEIQVPIFKGVEIAGVTTICKGGETLLKVLGDFESFEWNTGSTERMIRVKDAGQYEVKVKNKNGCTFTSSVNVEVRPCS